MLLGARSRRSRPGAGGLDHDEAGGPHTGTLAAVGGGAAGVLDGGDDGGVEDGARRRGQAAADALEGSGASRAGEAVEVAARRARPCPPPIEGRRPARASCTTRPIETPRRAAASRVVSSDAPSMPASVGTASGTAEYLVTLVRRPLR